MNGFYRLKKKATEMILLKSLIYDIGNGFLPSAVTVLVLISAPGSRAQTSRLAMDYYTRPDTSYRNGDLVGAIVDLEAAIPFDPGWAPPYLLTRNVRYPSGELTPPP